MGYHLPGGAEGCVCSISYRLNSQRWSASELKDGLRETFKDSPDAYYGASPTRRHISDALVSVTRDTAGVLLMELQVFRLVNLFSTYFINLDSQQSLL